MCPDLLAHRLITFQSIPNMNTIFVNTVPTPDQNVTRMTIDFKDFDPYVGLTFTCTLFNSKNTVLDRVYVELSNEDWQNWPASETADEDYNYVKLVILKNTGIVEYIPPIVDAPSEEIPVDVGILPNDEGVLHSEIPPETP